MGDREAALEAGGSHRFRAGGFEGPLDLLLHLVRINEVEITDIPIVEITRQYEEYLDLMRELNLEVAGEYLVMAASLMHIKSQMLLPSEPEEGEDEVEDPRAELTRQLLEYQRFKQAAENLQALDSIRALVWTQDGRVPEQFKDEELLTVDLFDLLAAFRTLVGRLGEEARLRLRRDSVSVAEKIAWLADLLHERRSVGLVELLASVPTRLERIAIFLALLEMMRLRMVVAFQRETLAEIRVAILSDGQSAPAPAKAPVGGGDASSSSDGRDTP